MLVDLREGDARPTFRDLGVPNADALPHLILRMLWLYAIHVERQTRSHATYQVVFISPGEGFPECRPGQ